MSNIREMKFPMNDFSYLMIRSRALAISIRRKRGYMFLMNIGYLFRRDPNFSKKHFTTYSKTDDPAFGSVGANASGDSIGEAGWFFPTNTDPGTGYSIKNEW